jgi:hypothetical protein
MGNLQDEITQWLVSHDNSILYVRHLDDDCCINQKFNDYEVFETENDILIKDDTNTLRILNCNQGEIHFETTKTDEYEEAFMYRESQGLTNSNLRFVAREKQNELNL